MFCTVLLWSLFGFFVLHIFWYSFLIEIELIIPLATNGLFCDFFLELFYGFFLAYFEVNPKSWLVHEMFYEVNLSICQHFPLLSQLGTNRVKNSYPGSNYLGRGFISGKKLIFQILWVFLGKMDHVQLYKLCLIQLNLHITRNFPITICYFIKVQIQVTTLNIQP